eukprot:g6842.t1
MKIWPFAALLASLLAVKIARGPRVMLPTHLVGHRVVHERNLIPPALGRALLDMVLAEGEPRSNNGTGGFPTNMADTDFYTVHHEHVGEAQPIGADGRCAHPFLVPSRDKSLCVLPGRVDIGRHWVMYGGPEALREMYASMIARVQSFGRYYFDHVTGGHPPAMRQLFRSSAFLGAARSVCPAAKQHLDAFQYNFILQVPGQTVPMHVDGVYFWGASRFQFPQWLLAAMKFSGRFEDRFVDQVQVVGYLHEWTPEAKAGAGDGRVRADRAGEFVVWGGVDAIAGAGAGGGNGTDFVDAKMRSLAPLPLAGTVVDGSKLVHAARVYDRGVQPPPIDKDVRTVLSHDGAGGWTVSAAPKDGGSGAGASSPRVLRRYSTEDLRISIVYRARCFENQQRAEAFRAQLRGDAGTGGRLSLDAVLGELAAGLPAYRDAPAGAWKGADRLALALQIVEHYVRYPLPSESAAPLVALNYCALPRLVPWTAPLLRPFCAGA